MRHSLKGETTHPNFIIHWEVVLSFFNKRRKRHHLCTTTSLCNMDWVYKEPWKNIPCRELASSSPLVTVPHMTFLGRLTICCMITSRKYVHHPSACSFPFHRLSVPYHDCSRAPFVVYPTFFSSHWSKKQYVLALAEEYALVNVHNCLWCDFPGRWWCWHWGS